MNTFDLRVQRTIEQLQGESYAAISSQITQRRMVWLDETLPCKPGYENMTPRQAFELLFFEQMRLEPADLPVIAESPDKIIWLSRNPCSLLQGCTALGLDTRKVCRPVNEKATQAFFSRINPRLRFHRSYEEIRPYTPHCKEWIVRVNFEDMMRVAIREAQIARAEGNKAYGAVVAYDGQIIGQAHNMTLAERDPSLHAEVNAIRQAVKTRGDPDLCGALLFSTCEPCPMCASLAVWANVTSIVYGVSMEEIARMGKPGIWISANQIVAASPASIEVIGGVLHDECIELYA